MDVIALRNDGIRIGLELTEDYLKANYKDLEKVVNGIGPQWFPEWARDEVTDYFEYFLPSTNQHDFDFDQLEKTEANFKIANKRLYKNMKIQIKKDSDLTWWSFSKKRSKWRKKAQAKFLYTMCKEFGESAFFKK